MAAKKHSNDIRREYHLALVARAYCEGQTQAAIAEQTGVTNQQISYDLRILQRRWLEQAKGDIDAARAKELAKLDNLEREYWAAYERSKVTREEQTEAAFERDGILTVRRSKKTRERDGNPDYLAGVMACIQQRCTILGLNAAGRYDVRRELEEYARKRAGELGLDEREALAEVERVLKEHRVA